MILCVSTLRIGKDDQLFSKLKTDTEAGSAGKKFFFLKTCNRIEFYYPHGSRESVLDLYFDLSDRSEFLQKAKHLKGIQAIEHLFRVTSGLDSELLGDYEIAGQVKEAVTQAKKKNHLGADMEYIANLALAASKKIKNNTVISQGATSYASVAASVAKNHFKNFNGLAIAVYGAGTIGKNLVQNLLTAINPESVTIINRTDESAQSLAVNLGTRYAPHQMLGEVLSATDLLFVCTAANYYLITDEMMKGFPVKMICDLSMPHNVDPALGGNGSLKLINLKDLGEIYNQQRSRKLSDVPKAEAIIEEFLEEYRQRIRIRHHLKHAHVFASAWVNRKTEVESERQAIVHQYMKRVSPRIKSKNDSGCEILRIMNEVLTLPPSVACEAS